MAILFDEYELIAKSPLFDAEYYRESNPDIAALNVDPVMHYLESGCRERRDPSRSFNTSHYLNQCEALGEVPENALVHYLKVGVNRGLTPAPAADSPAGTLWVDIPRIVDGVAPAPVRGGLSIVGWGFVDGGVVGVNIAVDGTRVTRARYGLRRPDVAAAHPNTEGSLLSGYAAHLPSKALAVGPHRITVALQGRTGATARIDFDIDVQEMSDTQGPWTLRRKMRRSEVDLKLGLLERLEWRPRFCVVLPVAHGRKMIDAARRTLESLARQTYPDWELWLIPTGANAKAFRGETLEAAVTAGFDRIRQHVRSGLGSLEARPRKPRKQSDNRSRQHLMARVAPGDEFGCDALLEFALAGGFDRSAEMLYSDDRRLDPDGKIAAFFKPAWSPDLQWSTNYLGRAWCATPELLVRAGISGNELGDMSDYEIALRLTETAQRIGHVAKVLQQRGDLGGDSPTEERRALSDALARRRIAAEVKAGAVAGHYRIRRRVTPGTVSIVIATCAAHGLIKTCLETLRAGTAYRDYEIICIENIPESQGHWQDWLRAHADIVVTTSEQFNWSRFNNQAARRATGRYLLFLNDDTEIIEPDWLEALIEQAQRPEVGVVGPLLLYPDHSVQQAGVMLDGSGRGRHAFRHLQEHDPGYFGLALTQRNVISVTGACLVTRSETFATLKGFDEAHAVVNNDLDYCLRAFRAGLINVYTPHARLIHHELASRSALEERYDIEAFTTRWRDVIVAGDPYFNTNLSREHEPFTIEREPFEIVHAGHPLFDRSSVERILVVKLDHLGDCITALPAVRRLKSHFPAAHISVLAAGGTLGIWGSEAAVDEVIEFNFFHARSAAGRVAVTAAEVHQLGLRLQAKRFDLAIDLRKQPETRHFLEHSGAPILAGFDHQGRFPWLDVALEWDEDVPLRTKHGHIADDLTALIEAVAAHSHVERVAVLTPPSGSSSLSQADTRRLFSKPLICVHPAAGSPMRQWPAKHFADLIQLLLRGQRFNVALIGGADENEAAEQVLGHLGEPCDVINLVGRLTLSDLPKVLAASVLFVGNNSGPQHWAAGLGVPTVGIHSGVVDAREWGPLGPQAVAVRRDMSCSPCYIEQAKNCPRQLACLTGLSVADVYGVCNRMFLSNRVSSKPAAKRAHAARLAT